MAYKAIYWGNKIERIGWMIWNTKTNSFVNETSRRMVLSTHIKLQDKWNAYVHVQLSNQLNYIKNKIMDAWEISSLTEFSEFIKDRLLRRTVWQRDGVLSWREEIIGCVVIEYSHQTLCLVLVVGWCSDCDVQLLDTHSDRQRKSCSEERKRLEAVRLWGRQKFRWKTRPKYGKCGIKEEDALDMMKSNNCIH